MTHCQHLVKKTNKQAASYRSNTRSKTLVARALELSLALLFFEQSSCAGTHWSPAEHPDPDRPKLDADHTDDGFTLAFYHAIVRSKVIDAFTALNRGDPEKALDLMDDDVTYTFSGKHALGGTRRSKKAVRAWFHRLLRLVPSRFEIREVEVSGWPWSTRVYITFRDHVTPLKGKPYINEGSQVSYLSWGSAYQVRTYVDTARLTEALEYMGEHGVPEALADPITDTPGKTASK